MNLLMMPPNTQNSEGTTHGRRAVDLLSPTDMTKATKHDRAYQWTSNACQGETTPETFLEHLGASRLCGGTSQQGEHHGGHKASLPINVFLSNGTPTLMFLCAW